MKKLLPLLFLVVIFSAAAIDGPEITVGTAALQVVYSDADAQAASSLTGNLLTITQGDKIIEIDFSDSDIDFLDPGYGFTTVGISIEDYKSAKCPKVTFCRDTGSSCARIISIQAISDDTTSVLFTKHDPDVSDSVVYIVPHQRSAPYLTAVANKRADLIIENNGIGTLVQKDGHTKVAVDSIFKSFSAALTDNREIDIPRVSLFELYSVGHKLILEEYDNYLVDSAEDRYFSPTGTGNPVEIIQTDEQWVEKKTADTDYECEETEECSIKRYIEGTNSHTCFCTRYNGEWAWRRDNDGTITDCESGDTAQTGTDDITLGCCVGQGSCGPAPGCSKIGFMLCPASAGGGNSGLADVKEFVGEDGWALGIALGDSNIQEMIQFVNTALGMGITPVVRLFGGGAWDRNPATPGQLAGIAQQIKSGSGASTLLVQVLNEPNIMYGDFSIDYNGATLFDSPDAYAQFVIDFASALSDPGIKVVSAGISPGAAMDHETGANGEIVSRSEGAPYIQALVENQDFVDAIDYWAHHSYSHTEPGWGQTACFTADSLIPEYDGQNLCHEGMFGYRWDLYKMKEAQGMTKPVLLTEFGYRVSDPNAAAWTSEMIGAVQADPYVEGAQIFLLQCLGWEEHSWQGSSAFDEVSSSVCSQAGTPADLEVTCDDGKGTFSLVSNEDSLTIEEKTKDTGSDSCRWESVYRRLTCSEMDELGEAKVFVRAFNEEGTPLSGQVDVKLHDQILSTGTMGEGYPVCTDEADAILGAGFAEFDYSDIGGTATIKLYMHNPETAYDYKTYDSLTFDLSILGDNLICSDRLPSYSVRFHQMCGAAGSPGAPVGREIMGLNIDPANPDGRPATQVLDELGVRWLRIEFKHSAQGTLQDTYDFYQNIITEYRNAGHKVLLILDYASVNMQIPSSDTPAGDVQWDTYRTAFVSAVDGIVQQLGDSVDAFEIWNEPDLQSATQGSYVPGEEFNQLALDTASAIDGAGTQALLVLGALNSGQLSYVDEISEALGSYDAISMHPYGKGCDGVWAGNTGSQHDLDSLLDSMISYGKPVWITEMGLDTSDEQLQADYLECIYTHLYNAFSGDIPVIFWFAYSDGMVDPFGLVREDGSRKPSFDAYKGLSLPVAGQSGAEGSGLLSLWAHESHFVNVQNPVPLPGGNCGHREAYAIHRSDITSSTLYMYHRCFNNVLPEICLTISPDDGSTFPQSRGIIISTDDVFAVSPSVAFIEGQWIMVYEQPPAGLFWATSADGLTWTKKGALVSDGIYRATPSIYVFDGTIYIFYAQLVDADTLSISFHSGTSMSSLAPHGSFVLTGTPGKWDAGAVSMPRVFVSEGYYWMVYEGGTQNFHSGAGGESDNVFGWGIARSTDLVNWQKYDWNPVMQSTDDQSCGPDMPQPYIDPETGDVYVYYTSDDALEVKKDRLVLGTLCLGKGANWHELNHLCAPDCSTLGGTCYQTKYCPTGTKLGQSWDCASCCS